jgi:hypothetical protein
VAPAVVTLELRQMGFGGRRVFTKVKLIVKNPKHLTIKSDLLLNSLSNVSFSIKLLRIRIDDQEEYFQDIENIIEELDKIIFKIIG